MSLPTLYKLTSTGKVQEWTITVVPGLEWYAAAKIVTRYGLSEGKKQTATEIISDGKNIGKSNETTPLTQAELEAKSQWEKKKKKGYVESIEAAQAGEVDALITGGIEPMLAHKYEEQGHKITYPAFVQPKLDGHRCVAIVQDGKATLWSRTRKRIYSAPHIERALELCFQNSTTILDGELYNHDYKDHFEDLTSLIRQSKPQPGHEAIQFWIYDTITEGDFEYRNTCLDLVEEVIDARNVKNPLVRLGTYEAASEEDMITMFGVFLENGYEGLMVRNRKGEYKNKRSYDLQKVKTFADAEFEVVAIEQGKGKMAGKAMFVCNSGNASNATFRVKMKGTLDSLKDYWENPEPWIGKQLTVKYQGLSADGIPRFPVAERFRVDV